jgi:hypothetical protein
MFIGHFAVGFGLKKVAPTVSLGTLFLGAQFLDLLWPTLLLAGVEQVELAPGSNGPPLRFTHYPISHSLFMVGVWSAAFGFLYYLNRRSVRGAVVCGVAVLSHWLLDLVVHHPDLPLMPGMETHVGFGLWRSTSVSLAAELGLFALGCWMYVRTTERIDRTGIWSLVALVVFLVVVQIANVFGGAPPSVAAVAWVGQSQWLLVLWANWVDALGSVREPSPAATRVVVTS